MSNYPTDLAQISFYLRKSRADLEAEARGEGETLSKHRRALLEMAKKYRYTIEDVYEEIVSGERILDRPEVQKLLHAVREGKYKAVLVMDIDRLGRGNMIDQGLIQDAFKSSGTLLITPRKVYDLNNEMDEEWSEFEAFMARRELKIITRRLQRGRIQTAAEGKSITNKIPYGYLRDENNILYPNPDTAPIIKLIFEQAAKGAGAQKIANQLTDLGIPSPSGNPVWSKPTIQRMILNPVYIGRIVWGKSKMKRNGPRTTVEPEAWSYKESAHEALVDQETFEKVQEHRNRRKHKSKTSTKLINPLASIVRCHHCGKAMLRKKRIHKPHDMFICETYRCPSKSARFEVVEERLIGTLKEILHDLQVRPTKVAMDPSSLSEILGRKIQSLMQETENLHKQRNNLHDLLEQGVYDIDIFLERSRLIGDRLDATTNELAHAKQEQDRISMTKEQSYIVPDLIRVLDQYERTTSIEQKNNLIKEIVESVIYRRDKEWTHPDHFELEVFLRM